MSIDAAIQKHGASAVYAAANSRLSGNRAPLAALGLDAPTLADAVRIQSCAYVQMGEAQRVIDLVDAQARLTEIEGR